MAKKKKILYAISSLGIFITVIRDTACSILVLLNDFSSSLVISLPSARPSSLVYPVFQG
jgi:hypothetical protein